MAHSAQSHDPPVVGERGRGWGALRYKIVSVDDHLIEPPDLFEGRMPAALAERAPKVVTFPNGRQVWEYEGGIYPNIGLNAVIGRPKEEWSMEPANFDEMRRGCWDISARIEDMDQAGIAASVCFPSLIAGFSGAVFSRSTDPALGLACVRAWNDWHREVWAGTYPGRMIGTQITWLQDPAVAAEMVRANAGYGFRALSFCEFPAMLGLPSLHSGHWDPLLAACEETETVVCLHTGSSSWAPVPCSDPPFELLPTLFPVNAYLACADWLWSGVCTRYPGLKIALSEGGVGWVNMLADRVDYVLDHSASGSESANWKDELKPSEVLARNFWFCTIDDPSTLAGVLERFGPDHVMLEVDYPHADSTWPFTQELVHQRIGSLGDDVIAKLTHENAEALFRWPIP
jgi:predicted TIM-barrel fold metal-dependent hydrolase